MFKESVICIIIVVVIFSLDVFTQDYTNKTTLEITKIFSDLKEQILKEDKEQITKQIASLEESWKGRHNKLAYYIEHDELEKIDTAIVSALKQKIILQLLQNLMLESLYLNISNVNMHLIWLMYFKK